MRIVFLCCALICSCQPAPAKVAVTCVHGTVAGTTCTCAAGWSGDACDADIDECAAATLPCDGNATCTNTAGSFSCACNDGFAGDGASCSAIDPCTTSANDCSADATCASDGTTVTCTCNSGFSGDGVTCTDVDECASTPCGTYQICTNTPGSYSCDCPANVAKIYLYWGGGGVPVGDMNGRAGADIVASAALPLGLPAGSSYVGQAFLSVAGDAIADMPANRCVPSDIGIYAFDATGPAETLLASNWSDFIAGPLNQEIGSAIGDPDYNYFWTGSDTSGAATGHDCSGWTVATGDDASISNRMNVTSDWLNDDTFLAGCDASYALLGIALQY